MSYPRNPHLTSNFKPFAGCGGDLMEHVGSSINVPCFGCPCEKCTDYFQREREGMRNVYYEMTGEVVPDMTDAEITAKYGERRSGQPDRRELAIATAYEHERHCGRLWLTACVVAIMVAAWLLGEVVQSERMLDTARHTIAAKQAELDNTYRQYNLLAGRVAK